MALNVKNAEGRKGTIDFASELQAQYPGAQIDSFDSATGTVQFRMNNKKGSINLNEELAKQGLQLDGTGDVNTPDKAADISPLSWQERWELGYLTRESTDFQRLISSVKTMFGGTPVSDEQLKVNEKRAIGQLKKRYEDATISNGELVVKDKGVWKKVDSSSDTIGQDAAQFLGNAGLNALGAIAGAGVGAAAGAAGGPLAPLTVPGAAIIGGAVGSMLGEVAEEATAVGIAGGAVDMKAAATDILTEGVLGLVGEAAGQSIGKALTVKGAKEVAKASAMAKEARVERGMTKLTETADSKVKDTIAQIYSTVNNNISEAPLREAIDSADNFKTAKQWANAASRQPADSATIQRGMAELVQTSLDKAQQVAETKFGIVLDAAKNKIDDSFSINLADRLKQLKSVQDNAYDQNKRWFSDLIKETENSIKVLEKQQKQPILYGKNALEYTLRQQRHVKQQLKTAGAYKPTPPPGALDARLIDGLDTIRQSFDGEITKAVEKTSLKPEYSNIVSMYKQTQDAFRTIWSKAMSDKFDITFAQKIAKRDVGPETIDALNSLTKLHPEAKIDKMLSDIRLRQAGLDMSQWLKLPNLTGASFTAGSTFLGPQAAAVVGTAAVSPKVAAMQARTAAKTADMSTNALKQAMPAARKSARALLGMAHSARFMSALGQTESRSVLQNPEAFNAIMQQADQFSQDLANADESKVIEAATRAAQEQNQQARNKP